jgi:hypothetical protein
VAEEQVGEVALLVETCWFSQLQRAKASYSVTLPMALDILPMPKDKD